jgi:hypothetical protein
MRKISPKKALFWKRFMPISQQPLYNIKEIKSGLSLILEKHKNGKSSIMIKELGI